MDIGAVLRRAWEITWRYKILWLFGFVAGLASAGGSSGGGGGSRWQMSPGQMQMPGVWVVALLALLLLVVALAVSALVVICQGALIDGVRQADEGDEVKGSAAWHAGVMRFWSLVGIRLLMFLAGLVALVPVGLMVILAVLAGVSTQRAEASVPIICVGLICLLPLIPIFIALNWIRIFADRACMLDGMGAVDALRQGWETLKSNLGYTVLVGFILAVIQLIIGGVFLGGLAAAVAPSAGIWIGTRRVAAAVAPLCCLGLLWALIALVANAVLQTYVSATWTLTYLGLRPPKAAADEVV